MRKAELKKGSLSMPIRKTKAIYALIALIIISTPLVSRASYADNTGYPMHYYSVYTSQAGSGTNYENDGATAPYAMAAGYSTVASGNYSLAAGQYAHAEGESSVALGDSSYAPGNRSTAVGYNARARGNDSFAAVNGSEASGDYSIAIGRTAKAEETGIAVGIDSIAAKDSAAFGSYASASGNSSVAAGKHTHAENEHTIAVGTSAWAYSASSIAVGRQSYASGLSSIAVGALARAFGTDSLAAGFFAQAEGDYSIATGYSAKASGNYSMASGNEAKASGGYSYAAGYQTAATDTGAAAIGNFASASGVRSTAFGNRAAASGDYTLAAGYQAGASALGAAAIGNNSNASGERSTAFGNQAEASGGYSLAAGYSAQAAGKSASALGSMTQATSDYSVALGRGSVAGRLTTDNNIYIPTGSSATWRDAIKATVKGSYGVVSIGSSDNTRQLTGVAAGIANTDAVNVAQLRALAARVNTIASSLSDLNAQSAPDRSVEGTMLTAAAPAESGTDTENSEKSEWTAVDDSSKTLLKLAGEEDSQPTYEKITVTGDGNNIGADMGGSRITNVAAGGIYQGSTDAVNGDQLWNAYQRIDEVQEDAYRAGAHAAALSALHPVAYDPYRPTTISAGLGFYHSKQSVAVGLFHYVKDSVLLNAGVSLNGDGDAMGRVGISFAMGKGGRPVIAPAKAEAMQKRIEELEDKNDKLQASNEELRAGYNEVRSDNKKLQENVEELKAQVRMLMEAAGKK